MELELTKLRFSMDINPGYDMSELEVGQEMSLTMDNKTFDSTIVDIDGRTVTHEVVGEAAKIVKAYLEPKPMSFSISSTKEEN